MHPEVLRSLVSQHTRDLRTEAANRRTPRRLGSLKVQAPSATGRHRILAVHRAADPSPAQNTLPVAATPAELTPMGIPSTCTATVPNRHERMERNAS
jgi:hypothetical protein